LKLEEIYTSGSVIRFHADPVLSRLGQTNADHQGRCVQLLLILHPNPSVELIRAVAFHDAAELITGDMRGPFKRSAPLIAELLAQAEDQIRTDMGIDPFELTDDGRAWLRLLDMLEPLAYVIAHAPHVADLPEWHAHAEQVVDFAGDTIGKACASRVIDFLDRLASRWDY
jgi:hypothetical protein